MAYAEYRPYRREQEAQAPPFLSDEYFRQVRAAAAKEVASAKDMPLYRRALGRAVSISEHTDRLITIEAFIASRNPRLAQKLGLSLTAEPQMPRSIFELGLGELRRLVLANIDPDETFQLAHRGRVVTLNADAISANVWHNTSAGITYMANEFYGIAVLEEMLTSGKPIEIVDQPQETPLRT